MAAQLHRRPAARVSGGTGAARPGRADLQGDWRDRWRSAGHRDVATLACARPSATAPRPATQPEDVMTCARTRQVLDAWLDGELDRATHAEIETHVQACAACGGLRDARIALRAQVRAEA